MASKSFVNLCATLTLCRFCAETVLKDCPESDPSCRKIRRLANRIVARVGETRSLWPDCRPGDARQVELRVWDLGGRLLVGERRMEELLGMCLALLSDMGARLHGKRMEAVDALCDLMDRLLKEFDGRGEDHQAYGYAGRKVREWYQLMEL